MRHQIVGLSKRLGAAERVTRDVALGALGVQQVVSVVADAVAVALPARVLGGRVGRRASAEIEMVIESVSGETAHGRTLVLMPVGVAGPTPFRAGQYVQIALDLDGETHRRSYSISAAEGSTLQITVKAVEHGRVSRHLVYESAPGDTVRVKGPTGRFVLPDVLPDATICCLAAGSGITPVLSIIATVLEQHPNHPVRLVYANRTEAETLFAEQLQTLATRHPRLEVIHVHSRPARRWRGEAGRLTPERAAALLRPDADSLVYLCGPDDLMSSTAQTLRTEGVPSGQIISESYAPRIRRVTPVPQVDMNGSPQVTWIASGITDHQRPGETLLAASQRVDADIPYICESGECGSCLVKVIAGSVDHEPDTCLSPVEADAGYILACSSVATEDVTLDA